MPTFPSCSRTLPDCLHFLRPSHYALLAYWIYFRPTNLKCYLYQAFPALYNPERPVPLWRKWGTPAYRNIFVMMPVICLLLTLALGGTATLACAWTLDAPIDWERWREGGMLGMALGMTIGMAFGTVGRIMGGIALSTLSGIVYGVTVGVSGGVLLSVGLGVSFATVMDGAMTLGTIFGVLGGMVFTLDVEIGVVLSLAFAVMALLSFGAQFIAQALLGMQLGALLTRGLMSAAFVVGAFRLLLFPIECILAVASLFQPSLHPVNWDELTVLPLPLTTWLLSRAIRQNEPQGLTCLSHIGRNTFRRAALQSVLYRYLHAHPRPIHFLYHILTAPVMQEYLLVPVKNQHWREHVSVRNVFLGELALRPVDGTEYPRFRRAAWWLNLRKRRATPLTRFAGMLYDFLTTRSADIDLAGCQDMYASLSGYPDGREIVLSYTIMTTFLSYAALAELPAAEKLSSELALNLFFRDAIRPTVLRALTRLGQVGADIAVYQTAGEQHAQLSALARAAGDLNDMRDYVSKDVMAPEQHLLQRIIDQWHQLIIETIGDLGKSEMIEDHIR